MPWFSLFVDKSYLSSLVSYVLASYAKFLWDVEEEEEEEEKECQNKSDDDHAYPPDLFRETNGRPHVTAAFQTYFSE